MSTGRANEIMLTVLLRHDQSQNVDQIQAKLAERQWWDRFPPEGVELVTWHVVMGIGQIVTLRMTPDKLPVVNLELERSAWGVFTTECYATYDFIPVRERIKARIAVGETGEAGAKHQAGATHAAGDRSGQGNAG